MRRPRGREEIEVAALPDLLEEVRRLREDESLSREVVVAAALRNLAERGLPWPSIQPNTPADELRRSYLASTPVGRLRETAELSRAVTTLAGHGAERHARRESRGACSRPPPLRFFDLLRVLRAHGVEFVVIGGFALAFHGVERATKGVDLVPAPGEENLTRLWRAFEELGGELHGLEDFRPEEMPVEWGLEGLIEGAGNWIVHTCFGRLDVMQWVAPFDSYDELRANAVEVDVDEVGAAILVAGLDDLIAMKDAAGRDQDRIDIAALRMAHGLEE